MWACVVRADLRLPGVQSLKEKRAVLRPHVERLRRLASLSVAEVGDHDFWQRSVVGVAIVAPDRAHLDSLIGKVRKYLEGQHDIELIEWAVTHLEEP